MAKNVHHTGFARVVCVAFIFCSRTAVVWMYPSGAGSEACSQQSPQVCHQASPQISTPPFAVFVQATTYSASERIAVSILVLNNTVSYKGFLFGAHRVTGNTTEYIGRYEQDNNVTQPLCESVTGTALTHTSSEPKRNLTFVWIAPSVNEGDILFKSAIVGGSETVYWVNVSAHHVLQPSGNWSSISTTAAPEITSSEPSGNWSSVTSTSAPETTSSKSHKIFKDPQCGHKISCYGDCKEDGCSFLSTWHIEDQWLVVSLKSVVTSDTNLWAAIGFGLKDSMNEASVTECIFSTNSLQAFMSFNKDYGNGKISPDSKAGLSQVSGSLQDGVLSCSFHRALIMAGSMDVYNLTAQKYHVMMARGTASGWDITPHAQSDAFVTSDSYNLTLPVDVGAKEESHTLVKLHGCLMTLAWIVTGSVGVLVARFYKDGWQTKTLCGVKVWFAVHRTCMTVTFFATAAGFALIFIKVGGYSTITGEDYQKAHPILGIIVTALTVLNPIMSFFRCAPNHEHRPIFNWTHWAVGTSAYILGVITLGIGTRLCQAPLYVTYVVIGFGVLHVLEHVTLKVIKIMARRDEDVAVQADLKKIISSGSYEQTKQAYYTWQDNILQAVIALHVVVATAVSLVIVVNVIG